MLVENLGPGDVDEISARLDPADAAFVEQIARCFGQRKRDGEIVGLPQYLVELLRSRDEGRAAGLACLDVAPHGADPHVEGPRPPGQRLTDVAEAQDAQRLAGELGPEGRRWRSDRPLTIPDSST